jgi:hypothetical protein
MSVVEAKSITPTTRAAQVALINPCFRSGSKKTLPHAGQGGSLARANPVRKYLGPKNGS